MNIKIVKNNFGFSIEDLMVVANRANNPKRNFLFVSKLLGKHIEVNPNVCKAAGRLMASLLYDNGNVNSSLMVSLIKGEKVDNEEVLRELNSPIKTDEKNFVLGFAETATGLGMSVASSIENSHYQTTTRENIVDIKDMLSFEEEHSHATSHKCFTMYPNKIKEADRIILVDDEITTGKSMRNLIRELTKITDVKKYVILSILDWRNSENIENMDKLKDELDIDIEVLSLVSGFASTDDTTVYTDSEPTYLTEKTTVTELNVIDRMEVETLDGIKSYFIHSGRFGVDYSNIVDLEEQCKLVAKQINEKTSKLSNILVIGHGEDIYIPSRVAAYVEGNVKFKTTTRSPIFCKNEENYPIKSKYCFEDNGVVYYLYNKEDMENNYDKVMLLTENELDIKLTDNIEILRV